MKNKKAFDVTAFFRKVKRIPAKRMERMSEFVRTKKCMKQVRESKIKISVTE